MDALTSAALNTLVSDILPRLRNELESLQKNSGTEDAPPLTDDAVKEQLLYLMSESAELMQIVRTWINPVDMSGDDDLDLLEESLFDKDEMDAAIADDLAALEEVSAEPEELSVDEEPAAADPVEVAPEPEEISDDDAAMLLADMDEPAEAEEAAEMSDDEAAMLLADMDEPTEEEVSADAGEMSDDEAAALLADMDEPAEEEKAGDMSDDEAAALLADMDKPAESADAGGEEFEDEAEKLLAELEGDEDDEEETAAAAAPAPEPAAAAPAPEPAAAAGDEEEGDWQEIEEWEANDFQTDEDMMSDFLTNSDELMENLDECILRLEQDPSSKETIEEIFRAAHTLKGGSGMFGFRGLERVMHRLENLFDLIRKEKMQATSELVDLVFSGMDTIRTLLDAVRNGAPCGIKTGPVVKALTLAAEGKIVAIDAGGGDQPAEATAPAGDAPAAAPAAGAPAAPAAPAGGGGDNRSGASAGGGKKKKVEASTIRVDLDRLDTLVNLIGELVIDRTRFNHIEEELRLRHPQLELTGNMAETLQLFGRHMNEIQDIIMRVRMVPVGNAFSKFPRVVRDLARSLGKEIDLMISGESAELDKTLVEQIGDPLIHLIRNAVDHGIEMPEDRVASGKNSRGTVFLSARQEGNHIVIEIQDDGKGMAVEKIREKGIERGLISPDEQLTNTDIFNLIFEAGFSTAEKVTEVSGRGVGMDVVKKQIAKLKGMIEIDSQVGQGTTIKIQLPLTLAIVQSLLVSVSGETLAIPLSSVVESIRIHPSEIQKVGDSEVIQLRKSVLPILHLDETLDLDGMKGSIPAMLRTQRTDGVEDERRRKRASERQFVVVVGSGERKFGIVVDQLLNQQEMVIKSMGPLMGTIPCVAGGAVLGQGEVVLVLDIADIVENMRRKATAGGLAA